MVRCGARPLPLDKTGGNFSVEAGTLDTWPAVIDALLAAVRAGELDAQLVTAAQERGKTLKGGSGTTMAA